MERAASVQPEFALTETNAPFIAQICQRLDGIALAVELAASRVKMFKVEQIAARLDDAFSLLTSGNRTALPRQQTLRALIDWSYNLLSEEEKTFLRKLSVFMGGWTLDAAEAVCETKDALDLLTHLVDKSLVSVDHEHGDETRYYLLETIRQYANEKFTDSKHLSDLRDLHLDYFLKTAERIAPELTTRKMPFWFDYLEVDYPNLHAALEWAQVYDIEAGLRLSNSLYYFWIIRGEYRKEGIEWFEKFLKDEVAKRNSTRTWALFYHYTLSRGRNNQNSDLTENKYLEESLLLARELEDHACVSSVLETYATQERLIGKFSSTNKYLKQSLAEARLSGNQRLVGRAIYGLGALARSQLDYKEATKLIKESVDIFCNVGDLIAWALALNFLGLMSEEQGDWEAAQGYYEKALALAKETHDRSHTSMYLNNIGQMKLGMGDLNQALLLLDQGRELIQNTPDDDFLSYILFNLGEVARFQGNSGSATEFYIKSLALPQREIIKVHMYCGLAYIERLQNHVAEAGQHLLNALNLLSNETDRNFYTYSVIPFVAYLAVDQQEGQSMSQEQVLVLAMEVLQ
ncbi:MAG: tetratricopeptide repeat protein [Anaerolineales bacterium]|nr:tetratricopeptide repeat protein [Anaerolineales bacterium]